MGGEVETSRPLYCFNGGFFTNSRVRRILELSGYDVRFGKPSPDDLIGVWGKSPTSNRGETVADLTSSHLCHVEDALLRSVRLGRDGDLPMGLTVDHQRPYFDSSGPSDLEGILATSAFDDTAILDRARRAIKQLHDTNLSKYNTFAIDVNVPAPGYVLVIDQSRDDASVTHGGANVGTFREMLVFAQEENPGAKILIKTHPDVTAGHRQGYYDTSHTGANIELFDADVSPYALLDGATAVYTVSSGMGFEAILAGHKPVVFGQPFYSGWGLTDDRQPIARRTRILTRAQLFAGAMIEYPKWYDPYRDCICELETVIDNLTALARAAREDKQGYRFEGTSLWKRPALRNFFGNVSFGGDGPEQRVVWASKDLDSQMVTRIEDGFIRSRGLGADLVPPLSLIVDPSGIYYDPQRPSRLDQLIEKSKALNDYQRLRAQNLRQKIVTAGLSKYNVGLPAADFDADGQTVVLVPGQVQDDASIKCGAVGKVKTTQDLLSAVRQDFPDAYVVYKPHPDVEAGLREGPLETVDADLVVRGTDINTLLDKVDHVATLTSLTGFEALLRKVPVSCYGAPFYAGWGLTDDKCNTPDFRQVRPTLDELTHACLINYPRYFDPVTQMACPVEVVVDRLVQNDGLSPSKPNRMLAKLQGLFSGYAHLWR